ncbi:hypothetical protein [Halostella litorea]|uniref:hypothetical protein n=1 Tax=Halostella litorea TaxID=2528831 RepID=UPI0010922F04|nr:hypothetical protein [Halostella litorea]
MKLATLAAIIMLLASHGAVPTVDVADEDSPVEVTASEDPMVGDSGGVLFTLEANTSGKADKVTVGRVGERGVSTTKWVQADDGETAYWFVYYGNISTGDVYVSHVAVVDGGSDTVEIVNIPDVRVHPSDGCSSNCERLKLVADIVRALADGGWR